MPRQIPVRIPHQQIQRLLRHHRQSQREERTESAGGERKVCVQGAQRGVFEPADEYSGGEGDGQWSWGSQGRQTVGSQLIMRSAHALASVATTVRLFFADAVQELVRA